MPPQRGKQPFGALPSCSFLWPVRRRLPPRDIVPLRRCCGWTSENSLLNSEYEAIGGFRSRALP